MSSFPPPQIPEHFDTIQERFKRWPLWAQLLTVVAILAVAVTAIVFTARSKEDEAAAPSVRDQRIEALRVTWNGLSAEQQFDICASVRDVGVDVAADQVQRAAGDFSAEAHDDVVFFLEDVACA